MATGIELLLSSICYNATFCGYYNDNPILGEQLTKKQHDYLVLKEEINGKHLKIGTYDNFPLSYVDEVNGTKVGRGVAFVLLEILRLKFNFTFELVVPRTNVEYAQGQPENSLIGLINSSAVDFGAAFVPILYDYQTFVSFSPGLDEGIWKMMLRRPKESATGSGLLAPFDLHVWYLVLAAVFSYGPCITILTRLRSKLVRDEENDIKLSPSYWFVYGAFIKQGTLLQPEANTTRVLFATWWIFIILLSAFYTANLTAFLTLSKFTVDVEYPRDLFKKNYRWMAQNGGAVQYIVKDPNEDLYYLNAMVQRGLAEFPRVANDQAYLPLVTRGSVLVREDTAIYHLMYNDYLKKTRDGVLEAERCTYVVSPNPFMTKMRAFAYPQNSTLKALFDPILTEIVQAGIIKHLLSQDLPATKICPLDLQSKDRRLRNTDLLMTYFIMVSGLAAAAAVFIGELFVKRHLRKKQINSGLFEQKIMKKKENGSRPRRHFEDNDPPPYDSLFRRNSRYTNSEDTEHKMVNGREYWVVHTISGDRRLIPIRTPSAFLYERKK